MNPIDIEVGKRVRYLRTVKGISQTELAAALGVTFQQVQKYEAGKNRISASRLVAIAVALDVRVSDILPDDLTGGEYKPLDLATSKHLQRYQSIGDARAKAAITTLTDIIAGMPA